MSKIMIASDIHGSAYYCRLMLDRFKEENAERLVLLGDILYHGPRNDLPKEYAPKEVIAMLNPLRNKIICVRPRPGQPAPACADGWPPRRYADRRKQAWTAPTAGLARVTIFQFCSFDSTFQFFYLLLFLCSRIRNVFL